MFCYTCNISKGYKYTKLPSILGKRQIRRSKIIYHNELKILPGFNRNPDHQPVPGSLTGGSFDLNLVDSAILLTLGISIRWIMPKKVSEIS